MTEKDLADMIEVEEKRLKLHSPEFMERHREIMETADEMRRENREKEVQKKYVVKSIAQVVEAP